ncbi:UNVERIFIED_CONTAM: CoA transferase subunit A, partial [Bacillus sp. ATCC 13368]
LVDAALTADIDIVDEEMADPYGNLLFDKSDRNTNPIVAAEGQITIVEVRQIVQRGTLNLENIIVPGAFVDYIIPSKGVDWIWVWEQEIETE